MDVGSVRQAYVRAGESAVALLRDPAVSNAWNTPSALREFGVSGLAGHLASQVFSVSAALEAPVPDAEDRSEILDHYDRAQWVDADVNSEINTGIRDRGEGLAAEGVDVLADRTRVEVEKLAVVLLTEPHERLVPVPAGWALRLEDFLLTRMMEIAVHSDDLAASVSIDAPRLPPDVLDPVLTLLARISARRHGQAAVLRALSRAERAPDSITAF